MDSNPCGKWFKYFLPKETYEQFIYLYPGRDYEEIWEALLKEGEFIRTLGVELAEKLNYTYPMQDDVNVMEYICKIKDLPAGVEDF